MSNVNVVVSFPARNEEEFLSQVLEALQNQTIKPINIIIANDGSTDKTKEIALSYKNVIVNDREKREGTVVGKIEMGKVWNDSLTPALDIDKDIPLDYIVFLGGDMILPPDYIEKLHLKFEEHPNLMIAAGKMVGDLGYKSTGFMIPGPGRMMRFSYWKELGGKYPLKQGWEAYPVYKAQIDGYETKIFDDVEYTPLRATGGRTDFYAYGMAMKAYGYFWPFALGRSLKQIIMKSRGVKPCVNMFRGYVFGKTELYEPEIREFINKTQRKRLRKLFFRF